mmetsp:Transcript_20846/g.45804  ORF Transcript_20846/g.45804 Transcript_20846/m.45804 type:complete len:326 (-) Transcript_20846:395-1372(-)
MLRSLVLGPAPPSRALLDLDLAFAGQICRGGDERVAGLREGHGIARVGREAHSQADKQVPTLALVRQTSAGHAKHLLVAPLLPLEPQHAPVKMLPLLIEPPQSVLHRHLQHRVQIAIYHSKLGVLLENRLEFHDPREFPRSLVADPGHFLQVLSIFRRGWEGQPGHVHLHLATPLGGFHLLLSGAGDGAGDGTRDSYLPLLRWAHPTRLALWGVRLRSAPPTDHQPLKHERRQGPPLMHLLQGAGHVHHQLVIHHLLIQLGGDLFFVRLGRDLRLGLRPHRVVFRDLGELLLELGLLAFHLLPRCFQVFYEQHAPEVVLLPLLLV